MNFDLIGAIELTASSAIVVVVISTLLGHHLSSRFWTAVLFVFWFVVVTYLGASGSLGSTGGFGVGGLGLTVLLPILGLAAAVRMSTAWTESLRRAPLAGLVALHAVRLLGVSFLILHRDGRLPATFAASAGWGDIAAGATALPLAWWLLKGGKGSIGLIRIWNIFGLLDLIAAVGLGTASSPGPIHFIHELPDSSLMTTLPWIYIPGFLVPLLASTHFGIFYLLRLRERKSLENFSGPSVISA